MIQKTYAIRSKINIHTETHTFTPVTPLTTQFLCSLEVKVNMPAIRKLCICASSIYLWHSNNRVHDHGYYVNK